MMFGGSAEQKRHISRSRISAVVCGVVLVVVGLALGLGIYRFSTASTASSAEDALPMPFGFGLAVVMSGSMSPALEVDDLVIVQPQENYAVGDIVVYQSGNSLVTHRVVSWDNGMLVAQGDANNTPDAPVSTDAVQGAVVLRIPFVGAIVGALKTPVVLGIVVLVAFALIALSFRSQRRERDAELNDLEDEVSRLKTELAAGRGEDREKERQGTCKAR